MSLSYNPDDAAVPVLPWNISYLSQRDVAVQVPINFYTEPGVSLQAACFSNNRYEDSAAALCFSNLLAIGFRRFVIDVYWDEMRAVWSLCPVQIPPQLNGTIVATTSSASSTSQSSAVASGTSTERNSSVTGSESLSSSTTVELSSRTKRAALETSILEMDDVQRRAVSSSLSTTSTITVTLSPTSTRNTTYLVIPTGVATGGDEVLYSIGPYECTSSLNLNPLLDILQEYLEDTDNTLHAFVNAVILNIHAAGSPFSPTKPASAPAASRLPQETDLLGSIMSSGNRLKLYTPQDLHQQRQDLNTSWFSNSLIPANEQPLSDYFNIYSDKVLSTPDGWPDPIWLQAIPAGGYCRVLAGFGTVDPQMTAYNFTGDSSSIFPSQYLQNAVNVSTSSNGAIQSGCLYQPGITNISLVNSSWAISSDLTSLPTTPLHSSTTNSTPILPSVANLTSCGISPFLNLTLSNTTADRDFTPYQAFAYNAIWSWSPGEPRNTSANTTFRCAALDPALTGRWTVVDCGRHLRGACVSSSSPYNWTLTSSADTYTNQQNACPANTTFMAPRSALENRYLYESALHPSSSSSHSSSAGSGAVDPVWINFNSLDVEFCWVVGVGATCPYVPASHVSRIAVPAVAGVIILIVAALLIVIKCRANRQNSRRSRKGDDGWDYEGVPS